MKWQMILTVLVAAVVGAFAGNLASRGFSNDPPTRGSSSALAASVEDQTRIVQAAHRDSPSVARRPGSSPRHFKDRPST